MRREVHGLHHVHHVHVVTRLAAVPVDGEGRAIEDAVAEDRDDAGLAVRILARAIDVREAQRDGVEAVHARVVAEVVLDGELRDAIRGLRRAAGALRRRDLGAVAVERAAGGREHESRARRARADRLEEVERAVDVHLRIEAGIGDALADVHLRGAVHHHVEASLAREARGLGAADVDAVEHRGGGHVRALAGGQVVEDGQRVAVGDEGVGTVGADEARAPGEQHAAGRHRGPSRREHARAETKWAIAVMRRP